MHRTYICMSLLLLAAAPLQAQQSGQVFDKYKQLCASCHGATMEGGSAPSMLDDVWAHGGDDDALARSIRDGYPDKGMPGWSATMSDKDIRAMVILIREQRAQARREGAQALKPAESMVIASRLHDFQLNTWIGGLAEPWSLAFLPDQRALVTEKSGRLLVIDTAQRRTTQVTGVPKVDAAQQAGLFDVAPHPDYARNGWIYLAYSDPQTLDGKSVSLTKIIRAKLRDNALVEQETIFQAPLADYPAAGGVHFGGRIAFDRAGYLYFTIGERGKMSNAQDLTNPKGKVHRLFDDGRIPDDNPFAKDPTAVRSIWSYGHRNPQGLAVDPVSGDLYDAEHGPRGGDEVNRIKPGANYGWPTVTYGMNYNGTPLSELTSKEGLEPPVTYWVPSIAVCGIGFYNGDLFPKWQGQLFVASLAAQELQRLQLADGKVVEQEVMLSGLGRIRDVVSGPDGALYLLLPERIARLTPQPMKHE